MNIEIKSWRTKAVLYSGDHATLKEAVEAAVKAGADLGGAYLRGAYLRGAYLRGADFRGAYLGGAYLGDAYLGGVDFRGADLRGAYLGDAYLGGAKFSDTTRIDTGETWAEYVRDVVPSLLAAGGRTVAEIVAAGAWERHSWDNDCPMHAAFGIKSPEQGPILLRPRIRQFVQFFDAHLIPPPIAAETVPAEH